MGRPGKSRWPFLALIGCVALMPARGHAQWWTAAPADFEDCAERINKSAAQKDAKTSQLADCDTKFAGRRKPGGGYSYYDFMQNRSFDIAGPNPNADEQKRIDEQYTIYLDQHRRQVIVAAFAEKHRQQQMAALESAAQPAKTEPSETKLVTTVTPRTKHKRPNCASEPIACGWSKLSSGIKDFGNVLFGSPPKVKRT